MVSKRARVFEHGGLGDRLNGMPEDGMKQGSDGLSFKAFLGDRLAINENLETDSRGGAEP